MSAEHQSRIVEVYERLLMLPRFDYRTPRQDLPANGIYFFFEAGERAMLDGGPIDRVVRIGTHRGQGNFASRIRFHYGNIHDLGGNKNASVFRRLVGGALLRRADPSDGRLAEWSRQMGRSDSELESLTSKTLRENFTFACIRTDLAADRLSLESGLIGLFAQHSLGSSTEGWLGRFAVSGAVRVSGLWNIQHINAEPLTYEQLQQFSHLVQASMEEGAK